jgi:glycosyltransferase involved in cell wall biosynthesis
LLSRPWQPSRFPLRLQEPARCCHPITTASSPDPTPPEAVVAFNRVPSAAIYAGTRALLAPSLWQEPAGRVAAEALLNGIPPQVSDRGGLRETCNGAGFYLPIPPEITPAQRALEASLIYRPENLASRYVEYFKSILDA